MNEDKIVDFIKRRFPVDNHWCDGNCLWMAYILTERFPELQIVYEPIIGHFMASDMVNYYDWTGKVDDSMFSKKPILLNEIKQNDSLWYERLMRDCKD